MGFGVHGTWTCCKLRVIYSVYNLLGTKYNLQLWYTYFHTSIIILAFA